MAERAKKMYALIDIVVGIETESLSTTSFFEAQRMYQKRFHVSGTTPRIFVDGRKLTITEADKLFGLQQHSKRRESTTEDDTQQKTPVTQYKNQTVKIAQEKTRKNHKKP